MHAEDLYSTDLRKDGEQTQTKRSTWKLELKITVELKFDAEYFFQNLYAAVKDLLLLSILKWQFCWIL